MIDVRESKMKLPTESSVQVSKLYSVKPSASLPSIPKLDIIEIKQKEDKRRQRHQQIKQQLH